MMQDLLEKLSSYMKMLALENILHITAMMLVC